MSRQTSTSTSLSLFHRIMGLGKACTILHLGAHPDDEDIGLMSYLPRKHGVRTVVWSATRGEGGQNRIGPYTGDALGVYRTWESMVARHIDGAEMLFGPFIDYGFSKNGDEALTRWGRDTLVREIVRVIRLVQPHIVIGRWQGALSDGHGHHQAVGWATLEAFDAAGNPTRFADLNPSLPPWQPLKLYHSAMGDWQPGEDQDFGQRNITFENEGCLRINTGEYDPITGQTYQEMAWQAFNSYQTQAMGFLPTAGDYFYYFRLHQSRVSTPDVEASFFDGLDDSLAGLLPDHQEQEGATALANISAMVKSALDAFRVDNPGRAASDLLAGLAALRDVLSQIDRFALSDDRLHAVRQYLTQKEVDFSEIIAECMGLRLACESDRAHILPGETFGVVTTLWNLSHGDANTAEFTLNVPDGWRVEAIDEQSGRVVYQVTPSPDAALSTPYWLEATHDRHTYHWPDADWVTQPFGPGLVTATCAVRAGDQILQLQEHGIFRNAFPGGVQELPLAVIPPVSFETDVNHVFLPAKGEEKESDESTIMDSLFSKLMGEVRYGHTLPFHLLVRNNCPQRVSGVLKLHAPEGWSISPDQFELEMDRAGMKTVTFDVRVPADATPGDFWLHYHMEFGERDYGVSLEPVRMATPGLPNVDASNCRRERIITRSARIDVHLIDVRFACGMRYGYIRGADETIVETLASFDLDFQEIAESEIGYLDHNDFDVIVVGPNAYLIHDALRNADRWLLDFVEKGGTLIVQYQAYGYAQSNLTPYPFSYSQPHDRVTQHNAPVKILAPEHRVFNRPNRINAADFDEWVRDRGLYFWGTWDERYQEMLASHDPGEAPRHGGLLIATYGAGTFVYTGLSFFRQIPAAVPGAFRLLANILALPATLIQERVEFLKQIPLFAQLSIPQLESLAENMTEQSVEDGTVLARQGEAAHMLAVIFQGDVEIFQNAGDGNKLIRVAKQGELLGELATLGDIAHTASIRTRGKVQLLTMTRPLFESLLHEQPDMAIRLVQHITRLLTKSDP